MKAEVQLIDFHIVELINRGEVSTTEGARGPLSTGSTIIASDGTVKRSVVKRGVHKIAKRTKQILKKVKFVVVKAVLNFTLKMGNSDKKKIGSS